MLRKEFFRGLRYPYLLNSSPNKRHDGLNIARAAYGIDPNILKVELNHKSNPIFKLESLSRMQGFDTSTSHTAFTDASNTARILSLIKNKQPENWDSFFKTSSKLETETIVKSSKFFFNTFYSFPCIECC